MQEKELIKILHDCGALLDGHFVLSSGLHSGKYIQCALLFQYPLLGEKISRMLAEEFCGQRIDIVIGPALGGVILAYEVARALGVKMAFMEREKGMMRLRRNFHLAQGEKVLVVEDVITTGKSVTEVISSIREIGAEVIGVGTVIDRSKGLQIHPLQKSLIRFDITNYLPRDCPLCLEGVPVAKPGSCGLKWKKIDY